MNNEGNGDETYSLIFKSLKHPIRRKILRMLQDGELTFSQILETLGIDSGHLSYHLDNLGDLITRTPDGNYKLSSFGVAAVKLMSGVEEHRPPPATLPSKSKVDTVIRVLSVVLVIVLVWASFYSMAFVTRASSPWGRVPTGLGVPFVIEQNQTFQFNVTMIYGGLHPMVSTEPNGLRIVTRDTPINTVTDWVRYYIIIDFQFNTTHSIDLRIRDPSGAVITDAPLAGESGTLSVGSGAYMNLSGTYKVEIKDTQTQPVIGNLAVEVWTDEYQRPLFNYGLIGVVAAFSYPLTVFVTWFLVRKKPLNLS